MEGASRLRAKVFGLNASYMPRQYSSVWKAPVAWLEGDAGRSIRKNGFCGLASDFLSC